LLLNLAAVELAEPGASLAIARTHAPHNPLYRRFGPHLAAIVDAGITQGLLHEQKSRTVGQLTTVCATAALRDRLPQSLTWADLGREPRPSVELRGARDNEDGTYRLLRVPIGRGGLVARWAAEIHALSARLSAALTIDGRRCAFSATDDGRMRRIRSAAHVQLVRIFNEDWSKGGRIFYGFWINMPKRERLTRLAIHGESVCEIDYRSMLLRIAYALAEQPWPFRDADPYTAGEGERVGWKRMTVALLFSPHVRQWPGKTQDERAAVRAAFPAGTKPSHVYDVCRQRHAAIAAQFGKAAELFGYEADLMLTVLAALYRRGIVAVPIHDSLIVVERHAEIAADTMRECGVERLGVELETVTTYREPEQLAT